jgi:uncharacterized protein
VISSFVLGAVLVMKVSRPYNLAQRRQSVNRRCGVKPDSFSHDVDMRLPHNVRLPTTEPAMLRLTAATAFTICAALTAFFTLASSAAHAASFDCAKAKTEDERAICKNAELSRLDEDMAAAYKAVAGPMSGFKERIGPFRKNQSEWIRDRARCGDTVPCLKDEYVSRIAWLKSPLLAYTGWWVSKKYRVSVTLQDSTLKPIVRVYAGPGEAGFMAMELQSRLVRAKDNQRDGLDSLQITPLFQPAFRKYEGQCSSLKINFDNDKEAYLATSEQCPLFKNDADAELKLKEATYYFTPAK